MGTFGWGEASKFLLDGTPGPWSFPSVSGTEFKVEKLESATTPITLLLSCIVSLKLYTSFKAIGGGVPAKKYKLSSYEREFIGSSKLFTE